MKAKKALRLTVITLCMLIVVVFSSLGEKIFSLFEQNNQPDDTLGNLLEGFTDFLPTEGTGFFAEQQQDQGALGENYHFDETFCFYFSQLSPTERAVYRQVYANAIEFNSEFAMVEELSAEELTAVMEGLRYDHPELFWLSNSYQYGYNAEGDAVSLILSFSCTAEEYPALQQNFNAAAKDILTAAKVYSLPIEQEKFIHDYLVDNCEYIADPDRGQSAYSALVEKKTVCAGYSGAFQYLMKELGIPCYYCPGTASGGSHAWNIILIDGEAYNVDLTWDDPQRIGESTGPHRYYNYFNLTDSQISVTHKRDLSAEKLPLCQSEAASYPAVFSPDPADRTVSYYRTAASLGLQDEVLADVSGFYSLCQQKIVDNTDVFGDLLFIAADSDTATAILNCVNQEDFANLCLYPAVKARSLYGYSFSMSFSAEELNDGNFLLVFTYAFEK